LVPEKCFDIPRNTIVPPPANILKPGAYSARALYYNNALCVKACF